MNAANRENFIESIYTDAIANGGDEVNRLISELDTFLSDDKKVLKYQLLDAVIRFTIEKADNLHILR